MQVSYEDSSMSFEKYVYPCNQYPSQDLDYFFLTTLPKTA